jgi:hypothetical protein
MILILWVPPACRIMPDRSRVAGSYLLRAVCEAFGASLNQILQRAQFAEPQRAWTGTHFDESIQISANGWVKNALRKDSYMRTIRKWLPEQDSK